MALTEPESMSECLYFTRRTLDDVSGGHVVAWVKKAKCPKCGKGLMGKPIEKGHVRIRSEDYECPVCKYIVSKEEYEPTLQIEIQFTCPKCRKSGETTTQYKRKSFQGVQSYVFDCTFCGEKIPLTKKMKTIKLKKGKTEEVPDVDA